jgi:tetratricopeptide (TPR) repeat protein
MPVELKSASAEFFSAKHANELTAAVIAEKKRMGMLNKAQGNLPQALIDFTSARDLENDLLGAKHPETAKTNLLIAEVLNASGRTDEALQQYQKAVPVLEEPVKKSDKSMGEISVSQGYSFLGIGDYENARKIYDGAVNYRQSVYGAQHIEVFTCAILGIYLLGDSKWNLFDQVANAKDGLALAHQNLKQYPEALKLYKESLDTKLRMYGEHDLSVAGTYNNMAVIYDQLGQPEDAVRLLDKVLDIKQRILEPQDLGIAGSLKNRGNILLKSGRLDEALNAFSAAVKIERFVFHDYDDCIVSSLKTISKILGLLGRSQESETARNDAVHVEQTLASRRR